MTTLQNLILQQYVLVGDELIGILLSFCKLVTSLVLSKTQVDMFKFVHVNDCLSLHCLKVAKRLMI